MLTIIAIVGSVLVPFSKNECDYQNISEIINEFKSFEGKCSIVQSESNILV